MKTRRNSKEFNRGITMAIIVDKTDNRITIQVTVELSGSMLEMEKKIQDQVNEVGNLATSEALTMFDSTGETIKIAGIKLTSKGKVAKEYQTPYGSLRLERYVYQTSKGGETFCPLDERAKIIISSTPKLAQLLSHKYASLSAKEVANDLELNHGRKTIPSFVQQAAETVGIIAQASEELWDYELPVQTQPVASISTSLDGTCVLIRDEGYREAMTGNISLYDFAGERIHTIYLGAAPESGKEKFLAHLENELSKVRKKYPDAAYIGLADGSKINWDFLEKRTEHHILDFYHATEYLSSASHAFSETATDRFKWFSQACHKLKHDENGALELKLEMEARATEIETDKEVGGLIKKQLKSAIVYFNNQLSRMKYSEYVAQNFPIGSGVVEAACKTLIKQRLCRSGMRWKHQGAGIVISLRALVQTTGRWTQFWNKINQASISDLIVA